jgi:hypothetical protein
VLLECRNIGQVSSNETLRIFRSVSLLVGKRKEEKGRRGLKQGGGKRGESDYFNLLLRTLIILVISRVKFNSLFVVV